LPESDNTDTTGPTTDYVVLDQDASLFWKVVGEVSARNADAAIREFAKAGSDPQTYVAVPARSWKPVTVKTETKTILTIT
jgi:hypothetical protein